MGSKKRKTRHGKKKQTKSTQNDFDVITNAPLHVLKRVITNAFGEIKFDEDGTFHLKGVTPEQYIEVLKSAGIKVRMGNSK